MNEWPTSFIGLLFCFGLVILLVLLLRVCTNDTKKRETFQKDGERDVVEIKTESYGAANNIIVRWCKDDVGGVEIKYADKTYNTWLGQDWGQP